MRALFVALALTAAPLGATLHADAPQGGVSHDSGPALRIFDGKPSDDKSLPRPPDRKSADAAKPDLSRPDAAKSGAAKAGQGKTETAKAEPDRGKRLDALFEALKAAPTKETAKAIADRIDVALMPSDSDTADLLMGRAAQATEAKQFDLAIQLLDGVINVAPDYLEAWNKRATVFYLKEDFVDSLGDLRQVVAREPRHYGAWAGIALIAKEIGDEKHALEAARRALAIYPQLEAMKEMEKTLSITVEGRPI